MIGLNIITHQSSLQKQEDYRHQNDNAAMVLGEISRAFIKPMAMTIASGIKSGFLNRRPLVDPFYVRMIDDVDFRVGRIINNNGDLMHILATILDKVVESLVYIASENKSFFPPKPFEMLQSSLLIIRSIDSIGDQSRDELLVAADRYSYFMKEESGYLHKTIRYKLDCLEKRASELMCSVLLATAESLNLIKFVAAAKPIDDDRIMDQVKTISLMAEKFITEATNSYCHHRCLKDGPAYRQPPQQNDFLWLSRILLNVTAKLCPLPGDDRNFMLN